MNSIHNSERGASMLYVLAALLFVGFISASMLKLSAGDSVSSVFYKTSASARSAAKSGMISAIHFFEVGGDPVKDLLQVWVDSEATPTNPDFIWIKGDATTYVDMNGNDVADPSGIQAYKVELLAFDTSTFNITLRSTGVGKGKSRAEIKAVHHLDGLAFGKKHDWAEENAIYLEDGVALAFRAPIEITGDVRISKETFFDAGASGSSFKGTFRSQNGEANDSTIFRGIFRFEGNTYFGTKPFLNRKSAVAAIPIVGFPGIPGVPGKMDFRAKVGFANGITLAQGGTPLYEKVFVDFENTSFWLKTLKTKDGRSPDTFLFPGSSNFYHSTGLTFLDQAIFKDESDVEITSYDKLHEDVSLTSNIILDSLDMDTVPCEIKIHPEVIPDSLIHNISGDKRIGDLAAMTNPTWNDFLVLRVRNNALTIIPSSDKLSRKIIVLIGAGGTLQGDATGKVFDVDINFKTDGSINPETSGHFTAIAMDGGNLNTWGGWSKFRGLFYCMKGGRMTLGGALNFGVDNLYGAIYANGNSNTVEWYPASNTKDAVGKPMPAVGTMIYDATVYDDLDVNGQTVGGNSNFLTKDKCADSDPISTGDLAINGSINASMVSQHF